MPSNGSLCLIGGESQRTECMPNDVAIDGAFSLNVTETGVAVTGPSGSVTIGTGASWRSASVTTSYFPRING